MSATLKPGESRVIREEPPPDDWMSKPNAYYLLRRSAIRLMERRLSEFWKNPSLLGEAKESVELLKSLADTMPKKPIENYFRFGIGIVREICCPNCERVFESKGNFYEPQCPHCKMGLKTRSAQADAQPANEKPPRKANP